MNAKRSLVLGVVIGAAVGAAAVEWIDVAPLRRSAPQDSSGTPSVESDSNEPLTAAHQEIARLEAENIALGRRIQALTANPPRTTAVAVGGAGPVSSAVAASSANADDSASPLSGMENLFAAQLKQQNDAKIRRMKQRLNLSPDQEEKIRALMDQSSARTANATSKIMKGDAGDADVTAGVDAEKGINDALTPEQQTEYAQMKTEENQSNARLVANSQLIQMQSSLGLTQEQQDKVFNVLYQQTVDQMSGSNAFATFDPRSSPVDLLNAQVNKAVDSLRGILTDQQLEEYRQSQLQQMQMVQALMQGNGGGGAGASNVQVLTIGAGAPVVLPGKP